MAKTPLRERALTDFHRIIAVESKHVTASGVIVDEPVLLFNASAYQVASGNNTFMRIRVHDVSGDIKWFLAVGGIGTTAQEFEGVLFNNGIYADFTSSAGTFGGSFEFVKIVDIPWYRKGMDVADINEAFARARTVSDVGRLGYGSPGGGSGGGPDPITPPSGGGLPPGGMGS